MNSISSLSAFSQWVQAQIRRTTAVPAQLSEPAATKLDDRAFTQAACRLLTLQLEAVSPWQRWLASRGFAASDVTSWQQIPALPAGSFKEFELTSIPAGQRTACFHSSGTTGTKPSRHFHHGPSLALYEASLTAWFGHHFPALNAHRGGSIRILSLTPSSAAAPHSSLAHMAETVIRQFGTEHSACLGTVGPDQAWQTDANSLVRAVAQAPADPVLLFGTAFGFVHLLDHLRASGRTLALPPGSCLMETGGYKGRSRVLTKSELHAQLADHLQIPAHSIVGEYGMSELSSQAYDAVAGTGQPPPEGRTYRFPGWARALVVSPENGAEVGVGEIGMLRIYDLANVWSVMAVQTEDLAVRRADGFTLVGRAARAEPRGCSLLAA